MLKCRESIFFFIFLLGCLALKSQDFKEEMENVKRAYQMVEKLSANVSIKVYESYTSTTPIIQRKAAIKKNADFYYTETDEIKMLMNDKYMVIANKAEKLIVYSKRDAQKEKKSFYDLASPITFDSILRGYDSVRYIGIENNIKQYVLYSGNNSIKKYQVFISGNGFIQKLIYYYDTKKFAANSKVMIEYLDLNNAPIFTEADFNENRFIVIKGKSAKPVAPYQGYEVKYIDNTGDI